MIGLLADGKKVSQASGTNSGTAAANVTITFPDITQVLQVIGTNGSQYTGVATVSGNSVTVPSVAAGASVSVTVIGY